MLRNIKIKIKIDYCPLKVIVRTNIRRRTKANQSNKANKANQSKSNQSKLPSNQYFKDVY